MPEIHREGEGLISPDTSLKPLGMELKLTKFTLSISVVFLTVNFEFEM
jgi:hypothetical protein